MAIVRSNEIPKTQKFIGIALVQKSKNTPTQLQLVPGNMGKKLPKRPAITHTKPIIKKKRSILFFFSNFGLHNPIFYPLLIWEK
jgi:hypothetical protein